MPFIDFTTHSPRNIRYDAVVVGCGAAGIFLATELAKQDKSVAVVETGNFKELECNQHLNTIVQTAKRQSAPTWNRKRMVGGTTTAWGGQSLPFQEIDFSFRPWLPAEWPLTYKDLDGHFAKANQFMNVDSLNYDTDITAKTGICNPGFADDLVYFHFSKWAPESNFLKLKKHALASCCDVYYNAHCTSLIWQGKGVVSGVQIASIEGNRATVLGKSVFLAGGGIETVRFLLLSQQQDQGRLQAPLSHLGTGFMDHPCMTVGTVPRCSRKTILSLHKQFATNRLGKTDTP